MATQGQSIGLWLERTSGGEPRWIVSRNSGDTTETVQTFAAGDFDAAYLAATALGRREQLPAYEIDARGNRECIAHPIDPDGPCPECGAPKGKMHRMDCVFV